MGLDIFSLRRLLREAQHLTIKDETERLEQRKDIRGFAFSFIP
jgi:hypothetical protein